MPELLSDEQLTTLRASLRRVGHARFPLLRADIDDLAAQAVADLWQYLREREAGPALDADAILRIAHAIFKRRAADLYRKSRPQLAAVNEAAPSEEPADERAGDLRNLLGKAWPQTAIQTAIPHSSAKLRLSAVNSTMGERWPNTLARGEVGMDPPWNTFGDDQLRQLASQTQTQFHQDGVTRDFRILAVHHPVHYPPPRPTFQMSLRNDTDVADALADFSRLQRGKLAHLLLSGHTHETYPRLGALPPTSTGQQYAPLYEGQLQLIAGSLSQSSSYTENREKADDEFIPQQFQILTFFSSPNYAKRGQLLMERRIVGRRSLGPYQFLLPRGEPKRVESVIWEY